MKKKTGVLFVCVHNAARSQMAEAFLKEMAGDRFDVVSAGFEPGILNPLAVEVMKEVGIDISGNQTKDVFTLFKKGALFTYVIAVCDEASAQRCPVFPGMAKRYTWSFEDPASFSGSYEEKLARTREVRDKIKQKIQEWINIVED
ncbi:MAG: arsenate reductase ArsC [Spirochaetota bacterium]